MDGLLPKKLVALLDGVFDRELAARLARVYQAAASTIEHLQAINLVELEPALLDEGGADLSPWEQLAPAVRDTVVAVNSLCAVVDEEFPPSSSRSGLYSWASSDERSEIESALVFGAVAAGLRRRLLELGTWMRRPELMASRWALLGELQDLRAELRARAGDAVFLSASACAPVRRDDVVPGATREIQRALLFRTTTADLRRALRRQLTKTEVDRSLLLEHIDADLALFVTLPAWRNVRAEGKRQMLGLRARLADARRQMELAADGLDGLVTPIVELLASLADEQTRAHLSTHDLDAASAVAHRLEQARLHLALETGAAARPFAAALEEADRLRGRDDGFDATVRSLRQDALSEADASALRAAIAGLQQGLQGVASQLNRLGELTQPDA